MSRCFLAFITAAALAIVGLGTPRVGLPDEVYPGIDLFDTPGPPPCPTSFALALPGDFFDPGSDPIYQWVEFAGTPVITSPPGAAGAADTIVERLDLATGTCGPGGWTVDIVLRALSLVALEPITVTHSGGSPELWDLRVCAATTQSLGSMTIRHECEEGGTFDSTLPVTPKLIFTRQSDSTQISVAGPTLALDASGSNWLHYDPTGNATTAPVPFTVDADCDGAQEPGLLPPTSNFVPSLKGDACACSVPPTDADALCISEDKPGARHQVVCDGCPPVGGGHFLCYKAKNKTRPAQNPDTVTLADQFESGTFDPGRVKFLCTPAAKNGAPVNDPDVHLKSYALSRKSATPLSRERNMRHPPYRVSTSDQFGTFAVNLVSDKRFQLMVPTSKSLELPPADPPEPPVAGEHFVDHYKCYNAHIDRKLSPSLPNGIEVVVEDQFGERSPVKIRKLEKLCTPVDKNGEGIIDSISHRTCYRIKVDRFAVPDVQVNNQFGPEYLELRRPRLLCIPALKTGAS